MRTSTIGLALGILAATAVSSASAPADPAPPASDSTTAAPCPPVGQMCLVLRPSEPTLTRLALPLEFPPESAALFRQDTASRPGMQPSDTPELRPKSIDTQPPSPFGAPDGTFDGYGLAPLAGSGGEAPPPSEIRIFADLIEAPGDEARVEATGNVRVTYQDYVLMADRVVLDRTTQTAIAEGHVRQSHAGQELQAERLEWDFASQQGRAYAATTEYRGLFFRGRELFLRRDQQRATQASFTTCDRPRPHYRLTARSIAVLPDDRVVARSVGLWLLGVRLITLPRVRYSLREGTGAGSLFPTIGYNARDGFYVGRRLPLTDRPDYTVMFDGKLALRRGFLGGVEGLETGGRLRWIGALKIKEQAPNQRVRFLEVDRLPEVGLLWAPQPDVRSRFLPIQVQDVERRPDDQPTWLTLGQLTLGYFRQRREEFRGDVAVKEDALRLDARGLLSGPTLRVHGIPIVEPRVLVRGALYSGGDNFFLLGLGLGWSWRPGRDVRLRLERFTHWQEGDSRFLFDDLEIRNEWRPHIEIRSGLNTFSWIARYDADAKDMYDQEFGFARVLHCLEPRLTYGVRRSQFGLEIRIVGLQRNE